MKVNQRSMIPAGVFALALWLVPTMAATQGDLPAYEELEKSNVSIGARILVFTSGMLPTADGGISGRGFEAGLVDSCGSGFIVKADGTVVTNFHVIRRAQEAWARFEDGSQFRIGHIKVYDPNWDLAVLKLASTASFQPVTLGDSESAKPLQPVVAVGNGLCQNLSATTGHINQTPRDERTGRIFSLRHDAVIAPGNSGGALYRGREVVGVNVSLDRRAGGIYYAVPVNELKRLLGPEYDRQVLLRDAFNLENALKNKTRQLHAVTGQVPGGSDGKNGLWALDYQFDKLTDYVIVVESPGRDLNIAVYSGDQPIGLGAAQGSATDGVVISSDYPQNVRIFVLNPNQGQAARFGLAIYAINW